MSNEKQSLHPHAYGLTQNQHQMVVWYLANNHNEKWIAEHYNISVVAVRAICTTLSKGDTMTTTTETPDRSQVEPVDFGKLADAIQVTHREILCLPLSCDMALGAAYHIREKRLKLEAVFNDLINQVRHAQEVTDRKLKEIGVTPPEDN